MSYSYQLQTFQQYQEAYQKSVNNPEDFWASIAANFQWKKPWDKVLNWNFSDPAVRWFDGAQLNITENCLDRHLATQGNTTAILWESNNPKEASRAISYTELHHLVNQFARVLLNHGVQKGDRVCLYMGMIPELAIATLACARIGAIHSIIFGGFSAQAIADRVADAGATCIVTCDGAYRGAKDIPLKSVVDEALKSANSVASVIVYERTKTTCSMQAGRDFWWHNEMERVANEGSWNVPAEAMEAEDPLFILYTSGSTGKPKGVVHTTAGYMVWANYTFVNVFQYQPGQVHFCTADIGWITGHSYIIYGPLSAGATSLMFEGVPTWPDAGRFWEIVEKHKVDILYTAPTAIRSLMGFGTDFIEGKDLGSLKVLGSVGEPINEEAWHWYDDNIGKNNCPIVDTWWQTETGSILISPLPGATPLKPGTATLPFLGVLPEVVDDAGKAVPRNTGGKLVIRKPWPSMLRGIWGDPARYKQTYWSEVKGSYFTGDGCRQDEDGYFWIVGRIDDVLNVAGHRIGTAEVESALVSHPSVAEAAVVGRPDELKGQALVCFVTLKSGVAAQPELKNELRLHVGKEIGPVARPDDIRFAEALPKTRSGKIMRRLLKQIATGGEIKGDTTTLEDLSVVAKLSQAED